MFEATSSDFLVPFNGSFKLAESATRLDDIPDSKTCKRRLKSLVEEFDDLQHRLYAADKHSVLLVFQAMDAAGKDSTIRAVLRGVNPADTRIDPKQGQILDVRGDDAFEGRRECEELDGKLISRLVDTLSIFDAPTGLIKQFAGPL